MEEFGNIEDLKFDIIEDNTFKILSKKEKKEKRDLILKDKYLDFHFNKLINLKEFKMPIKNEMEFIITQMSFNAFTFIPYILKTEKIISIHFSTFNLSKSVLLALGDFINSGAVANAFILINKMMKYDHQNIIEILNHFKKQFSFDFKEARNHSKINCIKTDKNYYVIAGSGNFSNNANIEQYVVFNNEKIYKNIINYFNEI